MDMASRLAIATTRPTAFIVLPEQPLKKAAPADCIIAVYLRSAVSLRTVNEFPCASYRNSLPTFDSGYSWGDILVGSAREFSSSRPFARNCVAVARYWPP